MGCIVKGCKNIKRLKPDNVHFFWLPKADHLLKTWLEVLQINDPNWQWTKNKYVCSRHFVNSVIIKKGVRTYLKPDAVPTLLLNLKRKPAEEFQTVEVSTSAFTPPKKIAKDNKEVFDNIKKELPTTAVEASTSSAFNPPAPENIAIDNKEVFDNIKKELPTTAVEASTSSAFNPPAPENIAKDKKVVIDNIKKRRNIINKSSSSQSTLSANSTVSTDSSTKRKRGKFVKFIHNYSASPGKIKKQYVHLRKSQQKCRQKLYSAKKTIKNLNQRITTLKTVMEDIKKNQSLSDNAIIHLEKCYEDVPHVLMSRYIKNVQNQTTSRKQYPEILRKFACTLQFYCTKAYEYVRETFALALPHQSVIRKWSASIECHPGFTKPSFDALKIKVEEAKNLNREVICSLLLDEMSIKKQIEFNGKRMWGYIDVGVPLDSDDLEPATEALVLMVVCHNSHWKIPIGYFLIKSLTGREKSNIVNEALIRLHEIDVVITSITCDGPAVHLTMLKELGCKLDDVFNLEPWFTHPSNPAVIISCILDICHMIKLMRNLLASLGQILTPEGNVNFDFIKKLYEVQETKTLHLANKLKKAHMEWTKQKMKVNLAVQTLSASIADALEFLCKDLRHPDFQGVEATVSFIRRIDRMFDLLNSRSPFARGYKAPLRESNEETWRPFLTESCKFLLECTDVGGRPLYLTPKKTTILGFVISSIAIMGIFDKFVLSRRLNYLLSYKCSQDHLEIFFCSVRSRNGWNNNPTCLQFMHTFRKLLLFTKVSERGGNCKVLDDTVVLKVPSTTKQQSMNNEVDLNICRRYNLDYFNDEEMDYDLLSIVVEAVELDQYTANVVTYIGGYVVKMLKKSLKCPDCIAACIPDTILDNDSYRLIFRKNRGGLLIPAEGLVKICQATEVAIKRVMLFTENKMPKETNFMATFVVAVAQQFYSIGDELFPTLVDHNLSFNPMEEAHISILIKKIVGAYARIRFFNLSKKYTATIQGKACRQVLTKLILFNHQ